MTTKALKNRALAAQGCLYIAAVLLLFASCSKDADLVEDDPVEEPAIVITSDVQQSHFADQTDAAAVTFTAAETWTASVAEVAVTKSATKTWTASTATAPATKSSADIPAWITVSPLSGTAGSNTLTVGLQPNDTDADRAAKITIESGGEQKDVTVTQKATTADGQQYVKTYDVYVFERIHSLYETDASYAHTRGYWKNGNFVDLSSAFDGVIDVAVRGDHVYAVGFKRSATTSGNVHAVYWHNGTAITLPETLGFNIATCIDVQTTFEGVNVYIGGSEWEPNSSSSVVYKYWVSRNNSNFVSYKVSFRGHYKPHTIRAVGNDLYIANDWEVLKNGVSASGYVSSVDAMEVSDGDIYWNGIDGSSHSFGVWKNGQQLLSNLDGSNYVAGDARKGLAIYGNDVYQAGIRITTSVLESGYWKNNTFNALFSYPPVSDGSSSANGFPAHFNEIADLAVVDGNVFAFTMDSSNGYYTRDHKVYKNGLLFQTIRECNLGYINNINQFAVVPKSSTRTW
ncbi:MAG: BACON domain-containing protein [Bacteroidales bacterium]|jgi:hypothetical protein|nr:BACON domain-containing protein [Bacteroidales bacterium]